MTEMEAGHDPVPGDPAAEMDRNAVLALFECLSSGIRLDIFRLLVRFEPDGLVAGGISERLSIAPSNLSFHLKALTQAGLLTVEAQGRFLRYRARVIAVAQVIGYLTEECCGNRPQRCDPLGGERPRGPSDPGKGL